MKKALVIIAVIVMIILNGYVFDVLNLNNQNNILVEEGVK